MSSALPADRKSTLVLSTDMLNESGLGKLDLNVNGNITFASSTDLELAPGSTVTVIGYLPGKSVVIDGSIRLPGGTFNLSAQGATTVKAGAIIDVSGLWTNRPYLVSLHADRRQWRKDRTRRRPELRDRIGARRQRRRMVVLGAQAETGLGRVDRDRIPQRWP